MPIFTGEQLSTDSIYKMLAMEGDTSPMFTAIERVAMTVKENHKTSSHIAFAENWYHGTRADPSWQPPDNSSPKNRNIYIAGITYMTTSPESSIHETALLDLKQEEPEIVLAMLTFYERQCNYRRNSDVIELSMIDEPIEDDNACVKDAGLMCAMLENLEDLRLKIAKHSRDERFVPAYLNN